MLRTAPVLLLLALLAACGGEPAPLPRGILEVGRARIDVEIARDPADRHRGLGGRDQLAPGHGMLFRYDGVREPVFTMRGMRFDLDLVWIREGRVVGISPEASAKAADRARTYEAPEKVDGVLEVTAGTAAAEGWRVGTPARLLGDVDAPAE